MWGQKLAVPNIGLLSTPEPKTDSGNDLFKNVLVDGFFFNPNWVIFEQHYIYWHWSGSATPDG